jgi:hypothetical protein
MERFGDEAYFVALCARSGLVGPEWPHRIAQVLLAFDRFGMLGGAISTAAIRHGSRIGLIDERGSLSYRELDRRSNAVANAWRERGLEAEPACVGKVVRGTVVKILDGDGNELPTVRPGGSSSATRCSSRATPAAATRSGSPA